MFLILLINRLLVFGGLGSFLKDGKELTEYLLFKHQYKSGRTSLKENNGEGDDDEELFEEDTQSYLARARSSVSYRHSSPAEA